MRGRLYSDSECSLQNKLFRVSVLVAEVSGLDFPIRKMGRTHKHSWDELRDRAPQHRPGTL